MLAYGGRRQEKAHRQGKKEIQPFLSTDGLATQYSQNVKIYTVIYHL